MAALLVWLDTEPLPSNAIKRLRFERVVNHYLEKNPGARFHSATDLAFAFEALSGSASVSNQTVTVPALTPGRNSRNRLSMVLAAVAVLAAISFAILYFRRPPVPEAHTVRFFVQPPDQGTIWAVAANIFHLMAFDWFILLQGPTAGDCFGLGPLTR